MVVVPIRIDLDGRGMGWHRRSNWLFTLSFIDRVGRPVQFQRVGQSLTGRLSAPYARERTPDFHAADGLTKP